MSTKIGSLAVPWPTPLFVTRTGESSTVMALSERHIDHHSASFFPVLVGIATSWNDWKLVRGSTIPLFHCSTIPFHHSIPFHRSIESRLPSNPYQVALVLSEMGNRYTLIISQNTHGPKGLANKRRWCSCHNEVSLLMFCQCTPNPYSIPLMTSSSHVHSLILSTSAIFVLVFHNDSVIMAVEFQIQVNAELMSTFGIKHKLTTAYHPQVGLVKLR